MPSKHFAIERVSVSTDGIGANSDSFVPDISGDGRYVAYSSFATNLVPGDDNNAPDIFIHDRRTNATEIISVDNNRDEGNSSSFDPAISDNGRFVTFYSSASDLAPNDANGDSQDIFIHDRKSDTTEIISVASDGNGGDGISFSPEISADGRYVVYFSDSTNLVSGDGNGTFDIFLYDRKKGSTERVSVSPDGEEANDASIEPDISADGRYVIYSSVASNLAPGDDNNDLDAFIFDRKKGTTELISAAPDGTAGNGGSVAFGVSANGRYVGFYSLASDLAPGDDNNAIDVFVRDRKLGTTERVSVSSDGIEGDRDSISATISDDGRFVAFFSDATNLVPGDDNNVSDVFVHERKKDTTTLLSRAIDGTPGNNASVESAISGNGKYVVYSSGASNLVPGDDNGFQDIFVASRFDWLV